MILLLFNLNILFTILWMFLWGSIDLYTLATGMFVGYLAIGVVSGMFGELRYFTKPWKLLAFFIYFVMILIKANLQVAREIITPGFSMTPRFVRYHVEGLTPLQITSLANTITLTPGTLSVDITDDNKYLYIHCIYAKDRDAMIREIDELRNKIMWGMFG